MALGGSTNAVLHLLAIAYEARVDLELDDFNRIAARVPHIADTKPHGRYHMTDVDRIGGVPVVMRELLDAGLLHGDCLTVTGRTMAENLADARPARARRRGRAPARARRSTPVGGIAVLTGSLAPKGSVVKVAGIDFDRFEGPARVFDGEDAAMEAILAGAIHAGDVVVIRYEGPKGGPGMREMLAVTGAMKGAGPGRRLPRSSPTVGSPAAPTGSASATSRPRRSTAGPIAFVRDGDRISIDVVGPHHRPAGRRGRAGPPAGRVEAARAPLHRAACWPSTPAWPRAPSRAPSPRPESTRLARRAASRHAKLGNPMSTSTRILVLT